jgi:hypothetical protein
MGRLLNAVIYIGPMVFLLGLLAAIASLALPVFGPGKLHVVRRALVTTGLGIAGFVVGTGVDIAFFCSTESTGNLCGLGGVFGMGRSLLGFAWPVIVKRSSYVHA